MIVDSHKSRDIDISALPIALIDNEVSSMRLADACANMGGEQQV